MAMPTNMKLHHDRSRKSRPTTTVQLEETDSPPNDSEPCDGYEAGRLLQLYGVEAVQMICFRVGKFGTNQRKELVSA